jgi:hypothetical protein
VWGKVVRAGKALFLQGPRARGGGWALDGWISTQKGGRSDRQGSCMRGGGAGTEIVDGVDGPESDLGKQTEEEIFYSNLTFESTGKVRVKGAGA